MSVLVSLFLSINVHFIFSQNTHEGDGVSWWRSTSDFVPIHGTQYGSLELRDAMYMEFDIVNHGPKPQNWLNVFRIGSRSWNNDCNSHMSRYPSLWMLKNENKWHFSISDLDKCNKNWGQQPVAKLETSYHMIVHYNSSHVFISIDDVIYIDELRNGTLPELLGDTVYIWISTDEWAYTIPAANVTMSNIIIVSYWEENGLIMPPSEVPTMSPTVGPVVQPTAAPSQMNGEINDFPSVTAVEDTPNETKKKDSGLSILFGLDTLDGILLIMIILVFAIVSGCTCFCIGMYSFKSKRMNSIMYEADEFDETTGLVP